MSDWISGLAIGLAITVLLIIVFGTFTYLVEKFDWILPVLFLICLFILLPFAIACGPLGRCS